MGGGDSRAQRARFLGGEKGPTSAGVLQSKLQFSQACGRRMLGHPGPGRSRPRRRSVVERRHRRVQLVVVHCGYQCPRLGLRLQLAQSAGQQRSCGRPSVALPPGIGRGRSARENRSLHCKKTPPPAPGFRDAGYFNGYGTLYGVGYAGYIWSSSIAGTIAHNLGFYYSWLNPQNSNNRANGLQLRCLQAFIDASVLASALPLFRFFPVIRMRLSSAGGCTRFAGRMCFESTGGQLPRLHVERSGKFSNLLPLSFLGPLRGSRSAGVVIRPRRGEGRRAVWRRLERQNPARSTGRRVARNALVPGPPRLSVRYVVSRRLQRVRLVVDGVRLQCPLLGLQPHLAQAAE